MSTLEDKPPETLFRRAYKEFEASRGWGSGNITYGDVAKVMVAFAREYASEYVEKAARALNLRLCDFHPKEKVRSVLIEERDKLRALRDRIREGREP